jgi:hypothetical protein
MCHGFENVVQPLDRATIESGFEVDWRTLILIIKTEVWNYINYFFIFVCVMWALLLKINLLRMIIFKEEKNGNQ